MTRFFQWIEKLSLRRKLFLTTSAGTLLVVAVGSLLLYAILYSHIDRDVRQHLTNSTRTIYNLVQSSTTTAIRQHLRAIATTNRDILANLQAQVEQGTLSEEEAKTRGAGILLSQRIGQTGYIFCINSKGYVVVHPKGAMRGADVSSIPTSRLQMERKEGYLEYEWANPDDPTPRSKALYMVYFAPWDWIISVSSYRDEFRDLVRVEDFRETVLAQTFGRTGYSFIMDKTGTLVLHPKLEGVNTTTNKDPSGNVFPSDLLERDRGTVIYDWINPGETAYRKKIAVFDSIPGMDWVVASTGYLDEIEEPLKALRFIIAATTTAVIVVLFLLSWWVAKEATSPLPQLLNAFDQGSHGNLSRLDEKGLGSEFGQMAAYYNRFIDHLEESRKNLMESKEKYRTIFEQALEGMFQLTSKGDLTDINPAMAKIFGYSSPEEMLGEIDNAAKVYVDSADREEITRRLRDYGKVVNMPLRLLRRDGTEFWGEVSERAVMDQDGNLLLVEGILKDVTAQKLFMEKLSKAKEEAEAASQLKSNFLIMISHEMRTPLTSMLGFSKMIKRRLQTKVIPELDASQKEIAQTVGRVVNNLDILEAESTRLARLIDNMLEFVKFEADEIILCLKPTNPKILAEEGLREVAGTAGEKGLWLKQEVADGLPEVVADKNRILQVLTNLLNNAVKFTETGGVTLAARREGDAVEFSVEDSGIGIPPEALEKIFDHFTQLGDVISDKPQGTGLGLALCRNIMTIHHGRIWAESKPGRGTVFRFTLPVVTKGQA